MCVVRRADVGGLVLFKTTVSVSMTMDTRRVTLGGGLLCSTAAAPGLTLRMKLKGGAALSLCNNCGPFAFKGRGHFGR